ncbi:MAG TPA: hypothetical protein VL307_14470 [Chitinophagaceae bacterium]|nr:hypothetical protein [Chitinophagaceae bacterium]
MFCKLFINAYTVLQQQVRTYKMLAVLMHLFLYVPFFAVQLLYNFDIAAHTIVTGKAAIAATHSNGDAGKEVKKSTTQAPVKAKIRLNKRFHPEAFTALECFPSYVSITWVQQQHARAINTTVYSQLPGNGQPLRGPPSFVYTVS